MSDSKGYINNVLVFGPGTSGNTAPMRAVNVPGTGCNGGGGITGIALDSSANLYVGDDTECSDGQSWVRVYAPTASGDAAWTRELNGSFSYPNGLAIDALNNLYVGGYTSSFGTNAVTVFAKGASSPSRTITGSNTLFSNNGIMGIAIDSTGTKLAVNVNNYNSCSGMYVLVFPASANGNVSPSRDLGQPCLPNVPYGAAFDKSGNLYVAATNDNEIFIYSPGAPNSSPPTAIIGGANTALNGPTGIAIDNSGDVFVANQGSRAITQYAPGARNNAAPIKTISGSNTGLTQPTYLAIGP